MNSWPAGCWKLTSSIVRHSHAQAHLGADRVERSVECLFRDGKIRQADRHNAALAPDKERKRLLERNNLERAGVRHIVVGEQRFNGRIDEHLQLRQLRMQAVLRGERKLIGKFELVGSVEFSLDLDRLDRGTAQPQTSTRTPSAPPGSD